MEMMDRSVIDPTKRYEAFDTVDWIGDLSSDNKRQRNVKSLAFTSWNAWFGLIWDSSSGWLCVMLIGMLVGVFAGFIDISSQFLSDFKLGICKDMPLLDSTQCCWSSNVTVSIHADTTLPKLNASMYAEVNEISEIVGTGTVKHSCNQWYSWGRLLTGSPETESAISYMICYFAYVFYSIIYVTLCALAVIKFSPSAAGSGLPEVKTILGGFVFRGFLSLKTLCIKCIGLILSVSSNMCVGYEGPMVHLASCSAEAISRVIPKYHFNGAKKRELLSAAVAAGISASFGPIGGVLFSLEEASYYFPLKTLFRSFFCALVAAYTAFAFNPFSEQPFTIFSVDYDPTWQFLEIFAFAFLGILGGLYGAIIIRVNLIIRKFRSRVLINRPVMQILVICLVYSLISYHHVDMRPTDKAIIRKLFSSCAPGDPEDICDYVPTNNSDTFGVYQSGARLGRGIGLLFVMLILKTAILCIVYGMTIPTGIMIPSICIGALIGRLYGMMIEQIYMSWLPNSWYLQQMCKGQKLCINPGLYAVVGAASTLGGVTRTTLSLVIIMIQVIGGLNHILPIMVAAMFARWAGIWAYPWSVYDAEIRMRGYPYLGSHDSDHTAALTAGDIMQPGSHRGLMNHEKLHVLPRTAWNLAQVIQFMGDHDFNSYPVVDSLENMRLVGVVLRASLAHALEEAKRTTSCNDTTPVHFSDDAFLERLSPSPPVFSDDTGPSEPQLAQERRAADRDTLSQRNAPAVSSSSSCYRPLYLMSVVDMSPFSLSDQTPLDTLIDIFKKMGLSSVLITSKSQLCGIVTKKDILRHLDEIAS